MNLERMLGSFIQSAVNGALSTVLSRRTAGSVGRAVGGVARSIDARALRVGALGVAVAAYEHWTSQSNTSAVPPRPPTPPPPPPPVSPVEPEFKAAPAPLESTPDVLLLLRTMIAAASADGVIDPQEQHNILNAVADLGLSSHERSFIEEEFARPRTIEQLTAEAHTSELAEQMYTVALLAINVDDEREHRFLEDLRKQLSLGEDTIKRITSSLS